MSEPTRVAVVAGVLGGKPGNSGHAWTRISLAVGLQRLGFDVVYVEQLPNAGPVQRAHFHRVCSEFSIPGYLLAGQVPYELISRLEDADLLLNIGGHLTIPELKGAPRVKVYLDDDPGYTQLWHLSDLLSGRLEGHDFHFTFGLNIGHPACSVPLNGIHWRPMHPPVVLDQWPRASTQGDGFRTVASWRGDYGRVEAGGQLYGQKAHEFRRFIHLPQYVDVAFEIALEFDSADANDVEQMRAHGWNIVHPSTVVGSPGAFRAYVQESAAEFSVARGIYVETNCGWFSDRTTRFLASGKPALIQDTGFARNLPTGEGLVAFTTLEGIVAGADAIQRDYKAHASRARSIAEEFFDSDKVLGHMLDEVGL